VIENLSGEIETQDDFLAWLRDGDLRGVTELVLWSAAIDDEGAAALAAHPVARQLRSLDLSHNVICAAGTQALADACPQLLHLRLYHNAIGELGASAIAAARWRLASLNVCGNALGPEGIAALRGPAVESVESLHLGWDELGDDGAVALAHGQWPELRELNVRSNELTGAGAARLLAGGLPQLTRLGLDDNPIGDDGLAAIVDAPGFHRLAWLNLSGTDLTERSGAVLERARKALRELRIDEPPDLDTGERTWEIAITVQLRGGDVQQHSFQGNEITFGRVNGNSVVLPHGNVARRHCRISIDEQGHATAIDMKSSNGTWINGRKMQAPMKITQRDKIHVGDFIVRLASPPRRIA